MALIVVIVIIAASYLYERNASFSGQSAISDLLFQIREQDIRLDRDVERIISFRLPHYDSLVQSGKQLQELIAAAARQQRLISRNYPPAFSDGLFRYLDTLKKKRSFIERIQHHIALVRNSFLYLPGLIEECTTDDSTPENRDLLNRLVMGVYTHYLFPDKVLISDIRARMSDIRAHSLAAGNLLKHVEITLGNTEKIEQLKQQMDSMDSDEQFVELRNLLKEYSLRDDRYSVLLGVILLLTVLLLLIWLWRTLERLDRARRLAEQSHERLQDAVESLGEAFALFDRDGRLVLNNQTFIRFYPWLKGLLRPGVTLEQIRKWNAPHMTCGSVAGEKPGEDCAGFANSEAPYYFERIGKDRWYLASNRRTKEGGTVSVRTDVSGSKASEQELRKLGRALEQSPASVVITDTGGVIEYVNPKFEQVSGYSAAEVLGRKPSVLKSGETTDEEYREMWRTLKAGKVWQGVFHNKRKDGSMYWEAASISPVRDDDGEISYFIGVK